MYVLLLAVRSHLQPQHSLTQLLIVHTGVYCGLWLQQVFLYIFGIFFVANEFN